MSDKPAIPRPSLNRLPLYYRFLVQAHGRGQAIVSSDDMARALGLPAAQIRKDLSHLRQFGRPGVGYDVAQTVASLERFLGLANDKEAIVVGAGRLGQALAAYPGFAAYGLHIVALFDNDPAKIGREVAGRMILPLARLPELVEHLGIRMGIIAVPHDAAQEVAEAMVRAGIKAIWNFAPARLVVPEGVWLENEDLAARLATLSYHLGRTRERPVPEAAEAG